MKQIVYQVLAYTFGFIGVIWTVHKVVQILFCLIDKRIVR